MPGDAYFSFGDEEADGQNLAASPELRPEGAGVADPGFDGEDGRHAAAPLGPGFAGRRRRESSRRLLRSASPMSLVAVVGLALGLILIGHALLGAFANSSTVPQSPVATLAKLRPRGHGPSLHLARGSLPSGRSAIARRQHSGRGSSADVHRPADAPDVIARVHLEGGTIPPPIRSIPRRRRPHMGRPKSPCRAKARQARARSKPTSRRPTRRRQPNRQPNPLPNRTPSSPARPTSATAPTRRSSVSR